jgi:hypothetical protein
MKKEKKEDKKRLNSDSIKIHLRTKINDHFLSKCLSITIKINLKLLNNKEAN